MRGAGPGGPLSAKRPKPAARAPAGGRAAPKRPAKKTVAKKPRRPAGGPARAPAPKGPARKTAAKKPARGPARAPAAKRPARKPAGAARSRILCISHKEDADGISAAALVRQATGADVALVDYPGQLEAIRGAAADARLGSLYICDLGLSRKTQDEFLELLASLRRRRVGVTYIDHHDVDPAVLERLRGMRVKVVHDTSECASVLAYHLLRKKLDDHATFVAACAAVTDYMEDRPLGSRLLRMYDRQFALISATVLTYNINGHQKEPEYLVGMAHDLAASKFPHQMPGSFEFAQGQVARLSEMIAKVKAGFKTMRNLAHMEVADVGAGGAVNFVMGLSGKDVGVAYRERVDYGTYAVSVRGSQDCKVHLGRIVNALSTELGGSGGGHNRACGALVPKPKMARFIRELNRRIG